MGLIKAVLVAAMLLLSNVAQAAGRESLLAQYTHQRWSDESDPPRPVFAMAQDHLGYLWVATATGLFRFDGIRFEPLSAGIDDERKRPVWSDRHGDGHTIGSLADG